MGDTKERWDPHGIRFVNNISLRLEMYVTHGKFAGWLAYNNREGWTAYRPASLDEVSDLLRSMWPSDQRFNLCRPCADNIPDPSPDMIPAVCPTCGRDCYKMPNEPPVLPSNVIGCCTNCALAGPALWDRPIMPQLIQEPDA